MYGHPFKNKVNKALLKLFFGFWLTICSLSSLWADGELIAPDKHGRYIWKVDRFRIFFQKEGEHAVPETDVNNNGIPDFVENIAIQMQVAHHIFCNLVQFPDPLTSKRYSNTHYIDVRLFSPTKMKEANGIAFDKASPSGEKRRRSLIIYISTKIDPKTNFTPTHEYFHQVQNGVTYFKNPWFYEGLARWSEDAVGDRGIIKSQDDQNKNIFKVLGNDQEMKLIFQGSYHVEQALWLPLIKSLTETKYQLPKNDPILNTKYTDGSAVMKDFSFDGAPFIRRYLLTLGKASQNSYIKNNFDKWSEENQRSPLNNQYILQALEEAVESWKK